jgi:hypothetical protein
VVADDLRIYLFIQVCIRICIADHSGRAGQGVKCLRSLEQWNYGFESHLKHKCLFAFNLCLCQVAALRATDSVKQILLTV